MPTPGYYGIGVALTAVGWAAATLRRTGLHTGVGQGKRLCRRSEAAVPFVPERGRRLVDIPKRCVRPAGLRPIPFATERSVSPSYTKGLIPLAVVQLDITHLVLSRTAPVLYEHT